MLFAIELFFRSNILYWICLNNCFNEFNCCCGCFFRCKIHFVSFANIIADATFTMLALSTSFMLLHKRVGCADVRRRASCLSASYIVYFHHDIINKKGETSVSPFFVSKKFYFFTSSKSASITPSSSAAWLEPPA